MQRAELRARLERLAPEERNRLRREIETRSVASPERDGPRPRLSVFFFSADVGAAVDAFRLFEEVIGAADAQRLHAVWVPERHFHRFGGPYPNPAVLAAVAAARSSHLQIRAGSVVLPLHDTLTVAEDWALVDRLSGGRAGVSFASGWNANDFVLRPEGYENRKQDLLGRIVEVQHLWRGGSVSRRAPGGSTTEISIFPRPASELPVWLTSSGSPETWKRAARIDANVLSALLEQSVEQVAANIELMRQERVRLGRDPTDVEVTLMVHGFVGAGDGDAFNIVRGPLTDYLAEHMWFYENHAAELGIDVVNVLDADRAALVEFAFRRYYESNGFFGSIEECVARARELADVGVTEIATLVDFGVGTREVVESVERLGEVRRRLEAPRA